MQKHLNLNFIKLLLSWYQQHKRDLPWRHTKDPYKIWISEIMLQQTQVITVIDYYNRFLKAFPTLFDLAKADEQEVLTLWSGLGYYSRARNLQKAAQKIVNEHAGVFPKDPEEILKLPGIGPYTRGAITSIAFDLPQALVDGNVIRVYSRLFALKGSPSDTKFVKQIWKVAEKIISALMTNAPQSPLKKRGGFRPPPLIKRGRGEFSDSATSSPGDFNQALMELGATICTPKNPNCSQCPVETLCEGKKLDPELFPERKKRTVTKEMTRVVWVILEDDKIQLIQDPNSRWHKGLWQLPGEWRETEPLPLKKESREEFKSPCIPLFQRGKNYNSLPSFTHHITHHKIKVIPYLHLVEKKNHSLKKGAQEGFNQKNPPSSPFSKGGIMPIKTTLPVYQSTTLALAEALKLPLPAPDKKILKNLATFLKK